MPLSEVEAVAEAWASIDGKLGAFLACKVDPAREETEGRFGGYMAEAEELIRRVEARGYVLLPAPASRGS